MIMRAERHGIDARGRVTHDPRRGPARSPDALSEPAAGRIGILGGGQLAAMIADAVRRAGLRPLVLAASRSDPAVVAGHEALIGRLDDPDSLDRFFAGVDVVTIENEFLDVPLVRTALERHPGLSFRPGLEAIALAQDKLAQKRLLGRLAIPTADFEILGTGGLAKEVSRLRRRFPEGFVLKWSRFGYDGRGNFAVGPGDDPPRSELERFCTAGRAAGATLYAERRIDFAAEVAMVSARGAGGAQTFLPLVTTRQEHGVCREVLGPAVACGLTAEHESQARRWLRALGQELGFCGSFAVEFFLDGEGRLLVNEMAPRVHNSGHYSLWPGELSQFDLHVQAIRGLPPLQPATEGFVLMRNILGPRDLVTRTRCPVPLEAPPRGATLQWYGKGAAARGRKMGHLTGRAETPEGARHLAAEMAAWEARYWSGCEVKEESRHDGRKRARRDHHGIGVGSAGHAGSGHGAR